jgi:phage gp46-like protein
MSFDTEFLTVVIDGQTATLDVASANPLVRAVLISLFTWRHANTDDDLPGDQRMGWWGDSFPMVPDDRIGSRLWMLARAKMVPETASRAQEYAEEALKWMVEDGVAARVVVVTELQGQDRLAINTQIYRKDGTLLDLRFSNVWEFLNV